MPAKRKLPNFEKAARFDVERDRKGFSASVLNGRIIMQEIPLFGTGDGALTTSPWPSDGAWREGFSAHASGMHPLAVAATFAFAHLEGLPSIAFVPSNAVGTTQRPSDDDLATVRDVAKQALAEKYTCDDVADEKMHDFSQLLPLYLVSHDARERV